MCRHAGHLIFVIAAVFALAGFVKGVIGLGLPTVSIGLLATTMPPAHALAIVIVPAIVTNIWQTFVGPYLRDIVRRLWPLLAGTVIGIWSGAGMMTGPYARYGTILLGMPAGDLCADQPGQGPVQRRPPAGEWVGGIVGLVTGLIAAATGIQVIPAMPFMQAIGMEKDELVQALGVFFTAATRGAGLQPDQCRTADDIDRAARHGGDGGGLRRHVHRPGGAHAAASRKPSAAGF